MSWWQYLILYPTLATSLFASIPTIINSIKAWRLGVDAGEVQLTEEQQRLWEKNFDCLIDHGVYEIDGPRGMIVKVTLCHSGDVLLRYYHNDWVPLFKWVGMPTLADKAVNKRKRYGGQ